MYVFTQRLFQVPYEWGRLAKAIGASAVVIAAGLTLTPDDGLGALVHTVDPCPRRLSVGGPSV